MPGVPVGGTFELTFKWSLYNQTLLSVLHYEVVTASGALNPYVEAADITQGVIAGGPTALWTRMQEAMPSNVTLSELRAQAIYPTRWASFSDTSGVFVGVRSPTPVSNVAAVITKRGAVAGRRHIGGLHLPTGGATDVANGRPTAGLTTALNNLANAMLNNINGAAFGGVYRPVIFHTSAPTVLPTPVFQAFPQDTVRTMHRRTVGLGI